MALPLKNDKEDEDKERSFSTMLSVAKALATSRTRELVIGRLVSGVEIREAILRLVLEEPLSGVALRKEVPNRLSQTGAKTKRVSDTQLYYNLKALQEAGILKEKRVWREKVFEVVSTMIPAVRRHFGLKKPWALMGVIGEEDTAVTIGRTIRENFDIDPEKYWLYIHRKIPGRWLPQGCELVEIPPGMDSWNFNAIVDEFRKIVSKNIRDWDFVVDVAGGHRIIGLALYQLALEYDLNCIYLGRDRRSYWIRQILE